MNSSKITVRRGKQIGTEFKSEQNMSFEKKDMETDSAICYSPRAHLNPESKFLKISV